MGFIATWMSSGEKYPFRSLPSTTFLIEQHGLFAYLGDEFLIFTLVVTFFLSWGLFCFSFRVPLLLISGSSASSKSTLNIWKFSVYILLKPCLENFKHYFTGVWDECNCAVVWTSFGIPFLSDWNENWPFPVLWPLLSFPNFLTYWVQHFNSIIF